jgi:hypothetical protein
MLTVVWPSEDDLSAYHDVDRPCGTSRGRFTNSRSESTVGPAMQRSQIMSAPPRAEHRPQLIFLFVQHAVLGCHPLVCAVEVGGQRF